MRPIPILSTLMLFLTAAMSAAAMEAVYEPAASSSTMTRPVDHLPASVAVVPVVDAAPLIQIAVLLDTSNSMDGLINQARSQLWAIVNGLGRATRSGRQSMIQVALYEYGKASISAEEQHLRQVLPFTTDLDRVSQQLFALTTNGGEEYCGAVIRSATRGLTWSPSAADLKVIIIAGNEPFTQGTADYRASCVEAVASRDIVINTIYCGSNQEGIASNWQDGARLGNGAYAAIDQTRAVVIPPAPQDNELARLGLAINDTYVPFGHAGADGALMQKAQDGNSLGISTSNLASRACAKGSAQYCNDRWDLIDAVDRKTVVLERIAPADLPAGMRGLTPEQRAAYVAGKLTERKTMQARIGQLAAERELFLAAQAKAAGAPGLDEAIITVIRAQAVKRGFTIQ